MALTQQLPGSFLEVRVSELTVRPPLTAVCAGYELKKWRCEQLASHMIQWLPDFALSDEDLKALGSHNAVQEIARAAELVYATARSGKRGEPGELLLHIILRQVFGSIPAIRKIYFKDSRNDTVKGFDAVHVVLIGRELELWLGEAKFYGDIKRAISAVVDELRGHTERDYLRAEFLLINNKIESEWPHARQLRGLLDRNVSLDKVFVRTCIPVLLTYDSKAINSHNSVSSEFLAEFAKEVRAHHEAFAKEDLPQHIRIHLLLLPLEKKTGFAEGIRRKAEGMPGDAVTFESLRRQLSDPAAVRRTGFTLLKDLCLYLGASEDGRTAQELILWSLERRGEFGAYASVLSALAREVGLFPYVEKDVLGLADRISYELHRPRNMGEQIVFHRPQAEVYRRLIAGENVVLSAPTSFGKSLIIDAVIASGKFSNVMIVVPTIALIDETRRRLALRFRDEFKIITHPLQHPAGKNLFVFTQERALEFEQFENVEFFIVDEFYKLAPSTSTDERWILLNMVFSRVLQSNRQFYLLGPNVGGISEGISKIRPCSFLQRDYSTVVSVLHRVPAGRDKVQRLTTLCADLDDPTIIFCSSPSKAADLARELVSEQLGKATDEGREAAEWVAENYHPDWHFVKALRRGIGIHHGRIPRALVHYQIRALNEGTIRFLICTSTMIEGVNTSAKNIVIYDSRINRKSIDLFTFNNIRGRSGRMFKHFVGHVYLFDSPPAGELPFVDVPALTQSAGTPEELLIQLDEQFLTAASRRKLSELENQEDLSYETLKQNVGVDPQSQLALARHIKSDPRSTVEYLGWERLPTYPQLAGICELIWKYFGGSQLGARSVGSARQLAYLIQRLRGRPRIKDLILEQYEYRADADEAVQRSLDFLRLWAGFHFPRLLLAIDRIQRDVFSRLGIRAGNYQVFASQVEHFFLDPALVALDEYGVPLELARKLQRVLRPDGNLDEVLRRLKSLNLNQLQLSPFEARLVRDAQESL